MRKIEKYKVSWTSQSLDLDQPENHCRIMGPDDPHDPHEPDFPVAMRQRYWPNGTIETFCKKYRVKVWTARHEDFKWRYAYLTREQLLAFEWEFR